MSKIVFFQLVILFALMPMVLVLALLLFYDAFECIKFTL